MKEKTLHFSFEIKHIPGAKIIAADALSRYPVSDPNIEEEISSSDINKIAVKTAASIINSDHICNVTIDSIKDAALKDPQHQLLIQKVTQGSFAKTQAEEEPTIREYFNVRSRLSIIDDLLVYNFEDKSPRLVIPKLLRGIIISNIHGAHQGTDSILSRVRRSVY